MAPTQPCDLQEEGCDQGEGGSATRQLAASTQGDEDRESPARGH